MWPSPPSKCPWTRVVRDVLAVDAHGTRVDRPQPGERVDQLRLAVPVDAGHADDLAGPHLERDAADLLDTAVVVDAKALDLEQRRRRALLEVFSTRSSTSRPTIRRARLASVAPSAGSVSISLPRRRTVIRSAMSSTSFSLWRDEDHGLAARREAADHLEQLLRLLRGEHGGRLVEDEDVRVAIERLQDLDALLLPDGDVLDPRRRVDRQPEAIRDLPDAPLGLVDVEHDPARGSAPRRGRCSPRPSSPG